MHALGGSALMLHVDAFRSCAMGYCGLGCGLTGLAACSPPRVEVGGQGFDLQRCLPLLRGYAPLFPCPWSLLGPVWRVS